MLLQLKIVTYQNKLHFQLIFFVEPNLRDETLVTVDSIEIELSFYTF